MYYWILDRDGEIIAEAETLGEAEHLALMLGGTVEADEDE